MTINYHSRDADLLFLLFAAVAVMVYLARRVYVARRKPNWRIPTLPVNRRNLRRIACLRGLSIWFAYIALVILLAIACWISGRLGTGGALGMIAVLLLAPAIYIYQILRLQYPPLKRALADESFDRELAGRTFIFLHSAWQYADADWYIRVGNDYSAALCARWIDFEKPAHFHMRDQWLIAMSGGRSSSTFGKALYVPQLRFTGRDGSEIVARLDCTPDVVKWVKAHGGRIEGM